MSENVSEDMLRDYLDGVPEIEMECMQEHICSAAPAVVEDYRDTTALSKELEVCPACLKSPVSSAALPVQCSAHSPPPLPGRQPFS